MTTLFLCSFAFVAQAADVNGSAAFNVDANYDIAGRSEIEAIAVKTSPRLYFFVDKNWWNQQTGPKQAELLNRLEGLDQEFGQKIYPGITSVFGNEWKPGIDGDERITVLFHQMKEGVGGYFRNVDEYLKLQSPESNEREMIYITTSQIESPQLKVFLAHEFLHLVSFNQKERTLGINEETWLNEARAEYVATLLGYDDAYEGSNLERRVKIFLEEPNDPLTEWQGKRADYGALNLFVHYLVDHYGVKILADSLKSEKSGIFSLNDALAKNGFYTDFAKIFTDWTLAVVVNDCTIGPKYCYLNPNLKNLRLNPSINFLPLTGKSTLSVTNVTKNWAGEWQKIIGGKGVLKLEFSSLAGLNYRVPYLVQTAEGNYQVNFLTLDKNEHGEVYISDFGTLNRFLVVIPSLQTKNSGFNGADPTYPFTFTVSVSERTPQQEEELIKSLLLQIKLLEEEIAKTKAQLEAALNKKTISCRRIENSLYFGMKNNAEVRCLQEFLANQGKAIYPEALVSSNFLSLTQAAVIRFQEKYAAEILAPLGLSQATGFVGSRTLTVINRLLRP